MFVRASKDGQRSECQLTTLTVFLFCSYLDYYMFIYLSTYPCGTAKAALFFMSFFSCPFICLLPIVTISPLRIGEDFLFFWPWCLYQSDGAKVCIKRLTGLPRIALYLPRTAFIINNSAPTTRRPIYYIPLLFSTPVLYISVCVDSLINKLYPLRTKITFDNVYFAELITNKKSTSHTLQVNTAFLKCAYSKHIRLLLHYNLYISLPLIFLTFWLLVYRVKDAYGWTV